MAITPEERRRRERRIAEIDAELKRQQELIGEVADQYGMSSEEFMQAVRGHESTHQQKKPDLPLLVEGDIKGGARALTEGITLGTGDELGAGFAAGLAKAFNPDEKRPWWDVYKEMHGDYTAEQNEFERNRPLSSTMLNLAGGMGAGGATLQGAMGALKYAPKYLQIPAALSLGSAEGAAVGAASADPGERGLGATVGAVATPALMAGVGGSAGIARGITDFFTQPRFSQSLGKGENFVPINMIEDYGFLPNLYRKTVAVGTGGKNIREQSQRVLNKALTQRDELTALKEQTQAQIDERLKFGLRDIEKGKRRQLMDAGREKSQQLRGVNEQVSEQQRAIEKAFRQNATLDSVPTNTPRETISRLVDEPSMTVN